MDETFYCDTKYIIQTTPRGLIKRYNGRVTKMGSLRSGTTKVHERKRSVVVVKAF